MSGPVSALRVGLVLLALVSGCAMLGQPEIACVDVDHETCHRIASELLATVREEQPTKQVVRIVVNGPHGVYDMTFSDGTGQAVVP